MKKTRKLIFGRKNFVIHRDAFVEIKKLQSFSMLLSISR
jgi:hypothetical protein